MKTLLVNEAASQTTDIFHSAEGISVPSRINDLKHIFQSIDNELRNNSIDNKEDLIEWVWVNQNGSNTETVHFNCAQNCEKKFFCAILSKTRFTHAKQHPLPSCYAWWVDHFVSQILHFPKMVNYLVKQ